MPARPEKPKRPWLELDGYKFPLAEGSGIQYRPVTQFAPAAQIGPANRPAPDPRYLVETFSDLTGGFGTDEHEEIDGIASFRSSSGFDTRFKQGVGPLPKIEDLTTLSLTGKGLPGNVLPAPTVCEVVRVGGNTFLYVLGPGGSASNPAYGAVQSFQFLQTVPPGDWVWSIPINGTPGSVSSANLGVRQVTTHGDRVVAACLDAIRFCRSGTAADMLVNSSVLDSGAGPVYAWVGLVVHDNKLYSLRGDDLKLYATTNPALTTVGVGQAWAPVSATAPLQSRERPLQLLEYRDAGGAPAIVLVTSEALYGLDEEADPAEWVRFLPFRKYGYAPPYGGVMWPQAHVWTRTGNLYTTVHGARSFGGLHVDQWTGTLTEVGPTKLGGYDPSGRFTQIIKVEGNNHWLFAWGRGDMGGGEVLAMNDQQGWHTVWTNPSTTDPIVGGAVDGGDIYVVLASGVVKAIRDYDLATAPHLRYSSGGGKIQTAGGTLYYGRTDFGLPNHWKRLSYIRTMIRSRSGSGVPAGTTLSVGVSYDGAAAVSYAVPAAQPGYIPVPTAGQAGVAFRSLELSLTGTSNGTADAYVIDEISLFAERWVEPFWAYQATLDLSDETFRGFPERTFDGRTLKELRDKLDALAGTGSVTPPPHFPAAWADGEFAGSVAAAELIYGGTRDGRDGTGVVQVSVRDMSMPRG